MKSIDVYVATPHFLTRVCARMAKMVRIGILRVKLCFITQYMSPLLTFLIQVVFMQNIKHNVLISL